MKKTYSLIFIFLCVAGCLIISPKFFKKQSSYILQFFPWQAGGLIKKSNPKPKEVWLNVFIHGSFGSLLGFISLPNVLKDEVHDTRYREIAKKMRDNRSFFTTQPILDRGLHRIVPTYNAITPNNERFAIYPLTNAFDDILKATYQPAEDQRYYSFGWSGLISQHRRRREAIRLFNALNEEILLLKKDNIHPRIRLITHSHGGNICLNLGAINAVLTAKRIDDFYKFSTHEEKNNSIKKMFGIIKELPTRENVILHEGQRQYDYIPTEKSLLVDELVMLGTPIQTETEGFFLSPIFKKIYNFYSDEDFVQGLDWVSTKEVRSGQKLNIDLLRRIAQISSHKTPQIIQARIMYNRTMTEEKTRETKYLKIHAPEKPSLLDTVLGTRAKNLDPDHRELWFFNWGEYAKKSDFILNPLPTVVIIPSILALISRKKGTLDVDFNVATHDKNISVSMAEHGNEKITDSLTLPDGLIATIKQKCAAWQPQGDSSKKEMNLIYQYLIQNDSAVKSAAHTPS